MAYMNQEKKATIAGQVKPIFKKYGVKATLAVRHHSTIVVNIQSGTLDFIGNANAVQQHRIDTGRDGRMITDKYLDVNPYWFQEHFSGVAKEFLSEAFQALKAADWYDESDAQTDYFNTAYYVDLNIGKWNKPYQLV